MKKYSNPKMEIVNLEETDVIKTSPTSEEDEEGGLNLGGSGSYDDVIEWG